MNVAEIIEKVEKVNAELNYWFVRTNDGEYFNNFYDNNIIAIGWDYLTINEINNETPGVIKSKIAKNEGLDINSNYGKSKITGIYNKIQTFISLKKDDIVLIPSKNSVKIAFGRVNESFVYEDSSVKEFIKRRKIDWIDIKLMNNLSPIFYQIKTNQHSISSIDKYYQHIDRVIGNLFKKGDNTHYVLNIEKTDDINFKELRILIDNIQILIDEINNSLAFNEDTDQFYIKVNLQSKGSLELIKSGKSLAIFAYLIFLASCKTLDSETDSEIKPIIDKTRLALDATTTIIDSLKMNTDELIKPFKNGN